MANQAVRASRVILMMLAFVACAAHALPPTATDDLFRGPEDGTVTGNVLFNDAADGPNTLSVVGWTPPAAGQSFTISGAGEMVYTPDPNFSGVVTFSYTIRENDPACLLVPAPATCLAGATGTIFVAPVADLPTLAVGAVSGNEDTAIPLGIGITLNDPDSEAVGVVIGNYPPGSTITPGTDQGDGTYLLTAGEIPSAELTPPQDYNGSFPLGLVAASIDTAQDETGAQVQDSDVAAAIFFPVTVVSVNDDPVADGPVPSISTPEDVNDAVDLDGTVSDADNDPLIYTVSSIDNTAVDTAFMTGSILNITVLPNQSDAGGSVTVEVTDGAGGPPAIVVVPVAVNDVNDDPFATGLVPAFVTAEDVDGSIDLDGIADDVDIATNADSLSYAVTQVNNSALSSASMAGSVLSIGIVPDQNAVGGSVTVQVTDSFGGTPLDVVIPVDVIAVNDDPFIAQPIPSIDTAEDTPAAVDLAGVVDDVDIATNSDVLVYVITSVDNAALASASMAGSVLSVIPTADQFASGSVTVQVSDSFGGVPVDLVVPVNVSQQNDDPFPTGFIPSFAMTEDIDDTLDLAGIVDDVDIVTNADALSYAVTSIDNTAVSTATMSGSILSISLLTDQNQLGGSVTVQVTDSFGGTPVDVVIPVDVAPVNDDPYIDQPIPGITTPEDTPASVDLAGVVADVDIATNADSLSYVITSVDNSAIDTASLSGSVLSVALLPDQVASGSVTVQVSDSFGGVPVDLVVPVTVTEVNDDPFATGLVPAFSTNEDVDDTLDLAGIVDDVDILTSGDSLSYAVTVVSNTAVASASMGGSVLSIAVAPDQNHVGGSVTVRVTDSFGGTPVDVLIPVDVAAVNDDPYIDQPIPSLDTLEDVNAAVNLDGVVADVDIATNSDVLSYVVTSIDNTAINTATMSGSVLTVTLLANQFANGSVTVQVSDSGGGVPVDLVVPVNVASVNDDPFATGFIPAFATDEDVASSLDLDGIVDDIDLPMGDSLSYAVISVDNAAVTGASMSGSVLNIGVAADQNELGGSVTVRVTDSDGGVPVDVVIPVDVRPVNDPPFVSGGIADVVMDEDDPPVTFSVAVFDDVDIATNADALSLSVANNSDPALFTSVVLSGDMLTLTLLPDANGVADITIRATDLAGASVDDVFTVTINSVNDLPLAADDSATIDEDFGPLTLSVLDNDYLAEQPTTITVGPTGQHTVIDAFDDPIVYANGQVTVNGSDIIYEPTGDYFGDDSFTYTITDADGDTSTATVSITVNALNDPPVGVQLREFDMLESQTLVVDAGTGVLLGAYDVDGRRLDDSGVPLGSVLVAQIETLPAVGVLSFNGADGSFTYTPPVNYIGVVEFSYRLFDNITLSAMPAYVVRIAIDALPPPPAAPPPGEVATPYNLSQVPLEQTATVPPNVLVVMDDSGSMDWNLIVEGPDENGGMLLSNEDVARGSVRQNSFVYLWDLPTNAYPPTSEYGRILPTEEALAVDADTTGNGYGVWRARSAKHNKLYYDPQVHYEPWIGQDEDNNDFVDAQPNAIRLDPVDPDDTFDMMAPHSYGAGAVPEWDSNGGETRVDVVDAYIPFYYATAAAEPLQASDARTKVEIRAANEPFAGGPDRDDCRDDGNPLVCTYAQELQNFANWFQYYRSREYVTKGAMGSVIAELQDIRVGYETISATTSEPVADMNDLYSEGEKKELLDNVYAVDSYGGTPLRQALGRAGQIFGCQTGADCPALPVPEGQCQQNFALLFSDGYWNGGTGVAINADEDGAFPFDGGRYADTVAQTLADVAMFYYENDLFDTVEDEVPIGTRDIEGAPAGTFDDVDTMHQHMKTYAIAFGVSGTITPSAAENHPVGNAFGWTDPFDGSLEKIDDMLHAALNGRGSYLSAGNPVELQSAFESAFLEFTQAASSASAAAFNSTSLRDGTLLYRGFYDLRDRTGELTATEVDTNGNLAATPVWRASEQLDPANVLPAQRVIVTYNPDSDNGVPFRHGNLAPVQQTTLTAAEVDFLRGERGNEQPTGSLRERELFGGLLGPIVNSSPVFVGAPRAINRDQEPYPTDDLYSEFAATAASRTPVVYVGGNDGILHGFDASTGLEVFGYVPNKILDSSLRYSNKLNDFTSPFYYHNYYVDLSPRLNDVYMRASTGGSKQWMTTLMGGLGAGGKGFFALNVNDPDGSYGTEMAAAQNVLWEFTDEDDTYPVDGAGLPLGGSIGAIVDPDGQPVKDLGYAVSLPLVQMTNVEDGGAPAQKEWAAIFGNGANSTSGIAKLFVLFMDRGLDGWDDAGDFVKIDSGFGVPMPGEQLEGYPNALGSPTAIDADLNGTVDYVYAGDRIGNLFRFDLTSDNPDDWHAVRLFTATYNDGTQDVVQPIQARPLVVKNPDDVGFIVIFGTGSLLTKDDSSNSEVQSIYGIWDRLTDNPATADSSTKTTRLVEQTITNVVDDSTNPALTRRTVTSNAVDYIADSGVPGTYGWYIDLDMPRATDTLSGADNTDMSGQAPPDPQFPGEKAVRRLVFRNGSVITTTVLPATDDTSCLGARPGSILVFGAFNGGDAVDPVIDFNTDGVVDSNDLVDVDGASYSAGLLFNQDDLDGSLVDLSTLGGEGDTDFLFVSGGNETVSYRITDINDGRTGRLSWIELDESD